MTVDATLAMIARTSDRDRGDHRAEYPAQTAHDGSRLDDDGGPLGRLMATRYPPTRSCRPASACCPSAATSRNWPNSPSRCPGHSTISAVTIPNIPVDPSAWLEDVAMEAPCARVVAVDDDVVALAGIDPERVAGELGRTQVVPVAGDDTHRHPVEVPRVHHLAFVHEPDADPLALLGKEGPGCRETPSG